MINNTTLQKYYNHISINKKQLFALVFSLLKQRNIAGSITFPYYTCANYIFKPNRILLYYSTVYPGRVLNTICRIAVLFPQHVICTTIVDQIITNRTWNFINTMHVLFEYENRIFSGPYASTQCNIEVIKRVTNFVPNLYRRRHILHISFCYLAHYCIIYWLVKLRELAYWIRILTITRTR